ncbi:MAG TPA: amidohydrolase family protein, partial [Nitriliruptorales bacterium]
TDPDARIGLLDEQGLDATVLFPNHGLVWEDQLDDVRARRANMRAHNRWIGEATEGTRRLLGVGHLDLGELDWLEAELANLEKHGVTLAMVAPSTVDGKSLAHPDLDLTWAAFAAHNVAPVFHVGAHRRPFDAAWYDLENDPVNTFTDSVLLWAAPAVALTNMAAFGVFERHPELRVGVVELTAAWIVPWLLYLDGGVGFISGLLGREPAALSMQPSEYVRRQVRVAALAYEQVGGLIEQAGDDLFMFGSDWPHAEGIADPLGSYRAANPGITGRAADQLYGGNVAWLAGLD